MPLNTPNKTSLACGLIIFSKLHLTRLINSAKYFFNHVYLRSFLSQIFFEWLLIYLNLSLLSCFFSACFLKKSSVKFSKGRNLSIISTKPHISMCMLFLDEENNGKNNRLLLGVKLCFTIVWGRAEISPRSFLTHFLKEFDFENSSSAR